MQAGPQSSPNDELSTAQPEGTFHIPWRTVFCCAQVPVFHVDPACGWPCSSTNGLVGPRSRGTVRSATQGRVEHASNGATRPASRAAVPLARCMGVPRRSTDKRDPRCRCPSLCAPSNPVRARSESRSWIRIRHLGAPIASEPALRRLRIERFAARHPRSSGADPFTLCLPKTVSCGDAHQQWPPHPRPLSERF
jgi:hypothetical protein